jgi:hypothetical protein
VHVTNNHEPYRCKLLSFIGLMILAIMSPIGAYGLYSFYSTFGLSLS